MRSSCWLGGYFNIPVWHFPVETVSAAREIEFFGMRYVVPTVVQWPGTIIAANVGGTVIPTAMSIYLLVRNKLWIEGAVALAIVTAVTHWLAEPVPGVGIAGAAVVCKGCARKGCAPRLH